MLKNTNIKIYCSINGNYSFTIDGIKYVLMPNYEHLRIQLPDTPLPPIDLTPQDIAHGYTQAPQEFHVRIVK
jgi:hypothetical protein